MASAADCNEEHLGGHRRGAPPDHCRAVNWLGPAMMQPPADCQSGVRCLDWTWFWTVLLQRQMGPGPVIITAERLEVAVQTGLVEHNQVVQAFATYGADDPFDIRALPWRTWRRKHLFDSLLGQIIHAARA
jgi:hypothetical protein